MFDLVSLKLLAGNGGNGHISFRREKYAPKGGPDGGDGGDGGNIIFRASSSFATLSHLQGKTKVQAKNGLTGSKRKKTGGKALDVLVEVPVGTRIIVCTQNAVAARRLSGGYCRTKRQLVKFALYRQGNYDDATELPQKAIEDFHNDSVLIPVTTSIESEPALPIEHGFVLHEFKKVGEEALICQGGFGGRGNTHFKAADSTTPRIAELGSVGEKMEVVLELRLLADIGLVGQPNVGKSTLLSLITAAKPKVADYPFTTLQPNLGILRDSELVIADIPGLIEGASQGKGLGTDFLRHISHCRVICLVISVEESFLHQLHQGDWQPALSNLKNQYAVLEQELKISMPKIVMKKNVLVLTKIDLYPPAFIVQAQLALKELNKEVSAVSSATGEGIKTLISALQKI